MVKEHGVRRFCGGGTEATPPEHLEIVSRLGRGGHGAAGRLLEEDAWPLLPLPQLAPPRRLLPGSSGLLAL